MMQGVAPMIPSGTIINTAPVDNPTPIQVEETQPADAESEPTPKPATTEQTSRFGKAILTVQVPAATKIFINDQLTTTKGESRSYVSKQLEKGKSYRYNVKAVFNRNGKEVVKTQTVSLKAGSREAMNFEFQPLKTTLAVHVPEDAKVILSGHTTTSKGAVRQFSTDNLEEGQGWNGYKVVAKIVRDGKTITREKTVDIPAGKSVTVNFDFNDLQFVSK